ncbi:MAG: DUF3887 domain-containing protein [Bacilli bacterium]
MKKFLKTSLLILSLFILVGCGAPKLSEDFKEEELKSSVEEIIDDFNNEKYEDIVLRGSEEIQAQLTADQLEQAWNTVRKDLGAYKELSKVAYTEKDDIATVIAIAKYENKKIQFTISYDKDMNLCGIYMK